MALENGGAEALGAELVNDLQLSATALRLGRGRILLDVTDAEISMTTSMNATRQAGTVPFHRLVPKLARGPLDALSAIANETGGQVVRLDFGPFRPYLVTYPDHVQQVLRGNYSNYAREGGIWRPVRRVFGTTIMGQGSAWETSRKILQPIFTSRFVASLGDGLAKTIEEGVGKLDGAAGSGRPIDTAEEMSRIVNMAVIRVLFGDKISHRDGERLCAALDSAARLMTLRLLVPFVPFLVPMPGDKAVADAIRLTDEVVRPLILKARAEPDEGVDVISALSRARASGPEEDENMRHDIIGIYAGATETTAMTLTWLWPVLNNHPEVYARLIDEVDRVVGAGPVQATHLPELRYTKMVLQELLRLYPTAWLWSRRAVESTELGGVRIKAGSQVLVSPYATHRLEEFWSRPLDFDPERFSPDAPGRRHRYSYYPFSGGPHQCLGQHLFYLKAPLIIAAVLRRFRPVSRLAGSPTPFPALTLRPKQKIELELVRRSSASAR
ncbi:cytochrome P450 [Streptosporangium fragile]|uniref:Cytochrome P450 n=1 Tax=Streptosporangium fragile TaxID=46186 RepID=A0ABP6IC65_9ACTN